MDTRTDYRITVRGCLDRSWSERLGGISMQVQTEADEAQVTVLTGTFRDQAALAGVLDTLYSLGFPLISVEPLGIHPEEDLQEDGYFDQSHGPSQGGESEAD